MKGTRMLPEQRDLLLSTYRDKGFNAAKPLAVEFGVSPLYVARLARHHGIKNRSRDKVALVMKGKYKAKRWAWAAERGAVRI